MRIFKNLDGRLILDGRKGNQLVIQKNLEYAVELEVELEVNDTTFIDWHFLTDVQEYKLRALWMCFKFIFF